VLAEARAAGVGVIDAFSPELVLNQVAHRDAVHLAIADRLHLGRDVYRAIIDGVCRLQEPFTVVHQGRHRLNPDGPFAVFGTAFVADARLFQVRTINDMRRPGGA